MFTSLGSSAGGAVTPDGVAEGNMALVCLGVGRQSSGGHSNFVYLEVGTVEEMIQNPE